LRKFQRVRVREKNGSGWMLGDWSEGRRGRKREACSIWGEGGGSLDAGREGKKEWWRIKGAGRKREVDLCPASSRGPPEISEGGGDRGLMKGTELQYRGGGEIDDSAGTVRLVVLNQNNNNVGVKR